MNKGPVEDRCERHKLAVGGTHTLVCRSKGSPTRFGTLENLPGLPSLARRLASGGPFFALVFGRLKFDRCGGRSMATLVEAEMHRCLDGMEWGRLARQTMALEHE